MNIFNRDLELTNELRTDFLRIFYYNFKKNYKEKYKTHEYIRLCTILSGEKNIKIGKRSYKYDKNQIMLLTPYSEVEIEILEPTKALVIEISDSLIENVKNKINLNFNANLNSHNKFNELLLRKRDVKFDSSLKKILDISLGEYEDKSFLIDLYSQQLIYDMLHIKEISLILDTNFNNPISKSIKIMRDNIFEKITITDIAQKLNMSVSNFSLKFKNEVGVSPNTYLRKLKLNKAGEMLKFKNVTEVSSALGYDNISYFIKLFKGYYGMTPKQYFLKKKVVDVTR